MATEDFTTYIEVDPEDRLTVTALKALAQDADADVNVYLYKDKGVDYFDALNIDFELFQAATSEVSGQGFMAISNTVGVLDDFADTDIAVGSFRSATGLKIRVTRGRFTEYKQSTLLDFDRVYWLTLSRAAGSNIVTLRIFDDANRTTVLEILSISGIGATKYRYCYGFVGRNYGVGDRNWDGYIQNMDLAARVSEILRPDAAGDVKGLYGEGWEAVDEDPPNDETSMNRWGTFPATGSARNLYNIPSLGVSPFSIGFIEIAFRIKGENYRAPYIGRGKTVLKTGGVEYDSDFFSCPTEGVWYDYRQFYPTNPNTGNAWILAEINALQIGERLYGNWLSGYKHETYCTQIYVTVGYLPVELPTVTTDPATALGSIEATLNSTLDDDGREACDCGFEWGETEAYGNTTPTQSRTTGQTFSQTISGLDPNKTYHFRAFATNAAGTSHGANRTFTTLAVAPTVAANPAIDINKDSATLKGGLTYDGGEACDCGFEYGLDTGYGTTTPTQSKVTGESFSQPITGLAPNTTYHFRAIATNSAGTSHSADRTFKTLVASPIVTTDPATGIGVVVSDLNGTLNNDIGEACECGFQWGQTTDYGVTTPTESKTTGESFSQVIGGLFPNTIYHFRAFGINPFGTGYGADEQFTTALRISRGYALSRQEL